ncbi:snake venom 5'-nucleotidase-like [Planococcus citri]|uniref:snake venom 5'-nucleotidase-like n=1 Tax=Planococcus citri TaxID=170843 RepID=UPI0031F849FC
MFARLHLLIVLISVVVVWPVKCDFEILVLHTNDMHSRFDEVNEEGKPLEKPDEPVFGGFARLKKAVDDARAEATARGIPSVFLNAGDTFQGTSFYSMLKDEVVSSLIPLVGIEAMSLGNHEFDDGVDTLARYLKNISIPVVACNLNFSLEPSLQLPILTPSFIIEKNNQKIGVIGYLLPETKNSSNTRNVIFDDEIASISREARRLKQNGVNIIVALGHSGFEMDKQIARSVPEVSLVIGGHTNTFLYSPPDKPPSIEKPEERYPLIVKQSDGNKEVPVVQAFAFTKYLGKLWITFDDNGNYKSVRPESNPMLLDHTKPEDASVKAEVLKWKAQFQELVRVIVGRTNVKLGSRSPSCRIYECNLGNLVTDAFIDAVAGQYNGTHGWTDAAIALIQAGAIRSPIHENKTFGNFTYEEILTVLPYKTSMYKVRVRGSDLREALEQSVSKHPNTNGSTGEFLHVSGIRVVYDFAKPVGRRITKLDVRCANCSVPMYSAMKDDTTYTIVMSQYLRDGGDGYSMFNKGYSEPLMDDLGVFSLSDTDAVANYFNKSQVNYPGIDGRIIFVNDELPVSPSKSSSPINSSIITLFVSISFVTWFYNMFTVATTVHHS